MDDAEQQPRGLKNEVLPEIRNLEQELNGTEGYREIQCGERLAFDSPHEPIEVALPGAVGGREVVPPVMPTSHPPEYERIACWEVKMGDSFRPVAYTAQGERIGFIKDKTHYVLGIGRYSSNQWPVEDVRVSRRHTSIRWGPAVGFWVVADSTTNSTYARPLDFEDAERWHRASVARQKSGQTAGASQEKRKKESLFEDIFGGSCSDVGERRENQDVVRSPEYYQIARGRVDSLGELRVVADGAGGHSSGALAAETAVSSLFGSIYSERSLVVSLNTASLKVSREAPGGASTVVAAVIYRDGEGKTYRVEIVNAGDSRAYLIGTKGMFQVSRDHSYVQALVDAGSITPSDALSHYQKNIITSGLGGRERMRVNRYTMKRLERDAWNVTGSEVGGRLADFTTRNVAGDFLANHLLMCSDGFSGLLDAGLFSPNDVRKIVDNKNFSMRQKAEQLVALAKGKAMKAKIDGFDNITVDLARL